MLHCAFTLIDRKAALIRAWRRAFADIPEITIRRGDLCAAAQGGAIVSPANAFGWMDGGVDAAIRDAYAAAGVDIIAVAQAAIRQQAHGELLIGQALVIPTPHTPYTHLIVSPTMRTPRPIRGTLHAYLAFRGLLLAIAAWNDQHPADPVIHCTCPGLGTGIGRLSATRAAQQMRTAWDAVQQEPPAAFPSLRVLSAQEDRWRYGLLGYLFYH
ncbi:MAG: Appr-1-p processing protein [Sulfobacillus thermosulfidooxidans]|nr:MAG: Appr-1-p processing protein [Sulfobacillus thermosulfidooxidans]